MLIEHSNFGIHIALSKYPLGSEQEYVDNLKTLYDSYKTNIAKYLRCNKGSCSTETEDLGSLYKPAVFHIFSHFDVAFVSLIDNFKFPQRVFEPWNSNEDEVHKIKSVSYQILSGGIIKTNDSPNPEAILEDSKEFLKIIQLKLNNGLLIGNGVDLFEKTIISIEDILKKSGIKNYVFVNSYNWGEITLLCKSDKPNDLANTLMELRLLSLKKIFDGKNLEKIKDNSLYNLWKVKNIVNAHIFSDTFSYLGVDYNNYDKLNPETPFYTNVEWQIKPGHFPHFAKQMGNSPLKIDEKFSNVYFKNGKTDYLIEENNPNILVSNIEIFNKLKENKDIIRHIRKLKTRPLYKIDAALAEKWNEISKNDFDSPINTEENLLKYKITNNREVAKYLKKLNVSRNIRKKINKIIYNYNLGIQDSILYLYFIDLHRLLKLFINELKSLSEDIENSIKEGELKEQLSGNNYNNLKTKFIQDEFIQKYIDVFEEALDDRILNNYNYEDINDFSLDLNSSLTGIISSLDSIIKFYGSCFRDDTGNSILTTINDNETVSNRLSVNYNIEHVTNAPLIFATLIKEILNFEKAINELSNSINFTKFEQEFLEKIDDLPKEKQENLLEFLESIDFAYFEIDFKKFKLTYFNDTKLYIFWHWTYALQCTHLYSSIGYFDEHNFSRELFRIIILLQAVDKSQIKKLKCPIPELRTYWDKYFNRIRKVVEIIGETDSFNKMTDDLKDQINDNINSINGFDKNINTDEIYSDAEEFLKTMTYHCHLNIRQHFKNSPDKFVKQMYKEIKGVPESGIEKDSNNKAAYYRILSYISYYNLMYIYDKFNGHNSLLRRDYLTGLPVEHFLNCNKNWFIDPFGGFFINDIEERKENMKTNNQMLFLIWHIGIILKKDAFSLD